MKVIFAGTPEFARTALEALLEAGFDVPLVLTRPERPAGRGMQPQASPVKQCALQNDIALVQPRGLRLDGQYAQEANAAQVAVYAARARVLVVAAYGLLLPPWLLKTHDCLNIHASLLPRWRGAAPIQRAIEAGDRQTGITIMHMDAGLDTGDIALTETVDIAPEETAASLHDQLAETGARLIVQALRLAADGALPRRPQEPYGVCYAAKIDKAEAQVNWHDSAQLIARRIRAFNPAPGMSTVWRGQTIKLWQAHADEAAPRHAATPGSVLAASPSGGLLPEGLLRVACGQGSTLRITQLQRSGGRRMAVGEFLRGFDLGKP